MHKLNYYVKGLATVLLLSLFSVSTFAQIPLKTDGTWKVSRTRPGGTPSGWTTLNYNDVNWLSATLVSVPNCLTPFNQTPVTYVSTTGLPIWANNGTSCSTPNDVVLFRKKFNVNKLDNCTYKIKVKADNTSQIYINEILVGSTTNNWNTGDEFDVTSSIINGQNIIAVRATDDASGITAWFSAVIGVFCGS